ncbi:hypothetical protein DOK67_0000685 [Enterococcus sp. DIV0212c]|uniref:nucleotidyltransferase family protein n=1 Tax=Enterococcus sp. DIV0212c TaxID=2230867 RepID=UPI001A9B5017|nr:nucleotidyltransferase family protein [Enterococcus sp. DIV0212c]MBO1354664.1 nucleotidyltransferase family protein [Enterococcus sp. DIV0212c]
MEKESRIVVLMAKFFLVKDEIEELNRLLNEYLDWSKVLGYLSVHRIMGVAWATVKKYHFDIEGRSHSWQKIFSILKENDFLLKHKQNEQMENMVAVYKALNEKQIPYAALKGISLLHYAYEYNIHRDFNDNDILINISDSEDAIEISKSLGYNYGKKSFVTGGIEIPDRWKVITRTMATHELFPCIKVIPDSFIGHHIIDFQFSLELYSKVRTEELVQKMLSNRVNLSSSTFNYFALDLEDTLIFTLLHYYKEAIYERKILDYKDLALYKLCDINFLVHNPELNMELLISRINEYDLNKACFFALCHLTEIFAVDIEDLLKKIQKKLTPDYFLEYYNDNQTIVHYWTESVNERLFDFGRANKITEFLEERK